MVAPPYETYLLRLLFDKLFITAEFVLGCLGKSNKCSIPFFISSSVSIPLVNFSFKLLEVGPRPLSPLSVATEYC